MTSFRFLRKLGEGTFAEVWEVEEEVSGNRAALKILKKKFQNVGEVYHDAEFKALQAFSIGSSRSGNSVVDGANTMSCPELLMLSGCSKYSSILHDQRHNLWELEASFHPRLTGIYDVFHDPRQGRVVFMLELLGHSLLDEILERKARRRRQQMFYERELRTVLYQILAGINELHSRGIFHRDIKPENILFRKNNLGQIKLADFGSCQFVNKEDRKIIEPPTPPSHTILRGKENRKTSEAYTEYIATRWYRSPECLLTAGHYGPPMDLWAAGCVAIELLTGLPFFPGENEIDQLSLIHKMFGKEFGNPTVRFSGTPNRKDIERSIGPLGNHLSILATFQSKGSNDETPPPCSRYSSSSKCAVENKRSDYESADVSSLATTVSDAEDDHPLLPPTFPSTKRWRTLVNPQILNSDQVPSDSLSDLLHRLLAYYPHERITAHEALGHAFFGDLHK